MTAGDSIYRRTQIAWPTIVPLVAVAAVIARVFLRAEFIVGLWLFFGALAVVLLLFSAMSVGVTSEGVLVSFGIGLVRKRIPFADVVSFCRVRNTWLNGWGIHTYRGGTLYNASGLSAVEFRMSSGRFVSVGTGEPDALVAAIQEATGRSEGPRPSTAGRAWGVQHTAAVAIGALALTLSAWTIYVGFQPPVVGVSEGLFSVRNSFYRDDIPFDRIRAATLEVGVPKIGRKTNGFAAGDTLRGNFRLEGWGVSRLYINLNSPPFLVIRAVDDKYTVVNFKDPEHTRELYSELTAQIDRSHR